MKATPFYKKENFWNAVVLTLAAVYASGSIAFPTEQAQGFVSLVFSTTIGGNFMYNFFKGAELRVKPLDVLKSTNVRLNILAMLAIIVPSIFTPELNGALEEVGAAITTGKLETILVAAFGFARVIYNLVSKPKTATIAAKSV